MTKNPTPTKYVYDNPQTGESVKVENLPNGEFYGAAESFDFFAKNAQELAAKLESFGFTEFVGYECD